MAKKIKKTLVAKVKTTSPVPKKAITIPMLSFYDAIREVVEHKRLTKVEWADADTYMFLKNEFLMIHNSKCSQKECKKGCIDHRLMLSLGDLEGLDWYVIPESN